MSGYIIIAIIHYFLAGALSLRNKAKMPIFDRPLMYHRPSVLRAIYYLSFLEVAFLIAIFFYNWKFALVLWISGWLLAPMVFAPIVEVILAFLFARGSMYENKEPDEESEDFIWRCKCSKYNGIKYKGIICTKCKNPVQRWYTEEDPEAGK